jgi:transcriptional activator for dhaKLM operon
VSGARAIEGQRQSDQLLAEQNSQLTQIKTILATISDGIAVLDADRNLIHINPVAEKILGIPAQAMLGRPIREFLHYPEFIRQAINECKPLTDCEITFITNDRSINCIISLRFVQSKDKLQWIVCTLRQEIDVRKLVHSQVGAVATLTLKDIPGESKEIRLVHQHAKIASNGKSTILIRGEPGTGKNPLARAIHNMSQNREGPFMIFPASSYPGELAVAELLGVEEGASSVVPGGRPSKFELANHGTLFFQDVHALPLEAQGILLNVIDLGIAQRFGSKRSIPVDVRIIASTTANLEQLIAQGTFRSSLFYRLRAFEIKMPPLRERISDIPILLERIVERLSRQLKNQIHIAPEVIELLSRYSWPGNIRELEAVIGRAAMQGGYSGVIAPNHLPDYILHPHNTNEPKEQIQTIGELEREAILHAGEICEGNASEMARLLGVGRTTLWRRLKTLEISLDDFRENKELTHG